MIYDTSESKANDFKGNDVNPISWEAFSEVEEHEENKELTITDDSENSVDYFELDENLRDGDLFLEDKIQELCKTSVISKQTCLWNFFDDLHDGRLYRLKKSCHRFKMYFKSETTPRRNTMHHETLCKCSLLRFEDNFYAEEDRTISCLYCRRKKGNCNNRLKLEIKGKVIGNKVKTRSYLWKFFNKLDGKYAICKICNKMIFANFPRHLQRRHPKSYMEWRRHSNLLQKEDSNIELVGPGRKKSSIWLFFNNVDDMAICKLCGHSMKQNMHRHLYNKHLKAYNKWQNIRIRNNEFTWANSVTRAKLIKRRRGWLKQYIKRNDINSFRCELCHKILKMCDGDYSNIRRHIRSQHPYIYDKEMKAYKDVTKQKSSQPVTNTEEVVEYVVEYINTDDPLLQSDTFVNLITSDDNEVDNTDVNLTSCQSDKVDENEKSDKSKHTNDSDEVKDLEINETLSDDDPLIEEKIKRLCRKNVEGKRQTLTCFWNFFNVLVVNKLYQCLFCAKKVSIYPKSVGNLKRHIAAQHTWQYNLILKYAPQYDSCKNSKPIHVKKGQPGTIKRSYLWKFFYKIDSTYAVCKICDNKIHANLPRHLMRRHPKSYMEFRRYKKNLSSNVNRYNKNSSIWLYFNNVKNMAVCKLCSTVVKNNMSRHLFTDHPKTHNEWEKIWRKEEKNKESSLSKPGKPRKSLTMRRGWVKQYVKRITLHSYRCELCHMILKMPLGEYSNMKRHIRSKHPYILDKEIKEYRDVFKQKSPEHCPNTESPDPDEHTESPALDGNAEVVEYVVEYFDNIDPLSQNDTIVNEIKSEDNELNITDVNITNCQPDEVDGVEKSDKSKDTNCSDDTIHFDINGTLSDNDPLIEDKIKLLCRKNVEGKRQTLTCFWNFFNVLVVNKFYRCMFCEKQVAIFPKSVGNLKRHIARKHSWQYHLILKYAPEYDSCKTSKPKYVKKFPPVVKDSVSNTVCFDVLDDGSFKCKDCEQIIVCGDDQKNLFDHVKEEHPNSDINED